MLEKFILRWDRQKSLGILNPPWRETVEFDAFCLVSQIFPLYTSPGPV